MTVTDDIFKAPTIDGTADELSDHMPQGKAWMAKSVEGSNLRSLIYGSARSFNVSEQQIELLAKEFDINQTTLLIDEWEESVGLPDSCLGALSGIEDRRNLVIDRLRKLPIVTLEEMQAVVDEIFPGTGVTLFPGSEYYTFEYDFEATFLGDIEEKFILVAEIPSQEPQFEYDFEVDFDIGIDIDKLRCVLERIIPANVLLVIEEVSSG